MFYTNYTIRILHTDIVRVTGGNHSENIIFYLDL